MNIADLTLKDFVFAAMRNSDKALALTQEGKLADVKQKALTEAQRDENQQLRFQFAGVLSEAYREVGVPLDRIYDICRKLGLARADAAGIAILNKPLTGREIKCALEDMQKQLAANGQNLVHEEEEYALRKYGCYDDAAYREALDNVAKGPYATVASMTSGMKALLKEMPKGTFPGLTAKNAETFVKTNFAQLKQLAFDHMFCRIHSEGLAANPTEALGSAVSRLMHIYGARGEALAPEVMTFSRTLELVAGKAEPPVVDKALADRFPPPDALRGMLGALRSFSNPKHPTARRLAIVADRLEAAWLKAASSQNDVEHLAEAALAAFKAELGEEDAKFLLSHDWSEANIHGDDFLKLLDAKIVAGLSAKEDSIRTDETSLASLASVLMDAAFATMKQDDMLFLAHEVATMAIYDSKVDIAKLAEAGKINDIYDQAERLARDLNSDTVAKLYSAAFKGVELTMDVLEGSNTANDVQTAYDAFKAAIVEIVKARVASAVNRDVVFREVGEKLPPQNAEEVAHAEVFGKGKDLDKTLRCKCKVLSLYCSKAELEALYAPPKAGDAEARRQEIIARIDAKLSRIPDAWFNPVMNALKCGLSITSLDFNVLPAVLNGLGERKLPPLMSHLFRDFSKPGLDMSTFISNMLSNDDGIKYEKTCAVFRKYHDALKGGDELETDYQNYNVQGDHKDANFISGHNQDGPLNIPQPDDLTKLDAQAVLKLMQTFGLSVEDLGTDGGFAKLSLVRMLLVARGGNADGIAEWGQRMFGVDFRAPGTDYFETAAEKIGAYLKDLDASYKEYDEDGRAKLTKDPLTELAKGNPAVGFLAGLRTFAEAKIAAADVNGLVAAVGRIRNGDAAAECTLGKTKVTLANAPDGQSVVVTVQGEKTLQVKYPQSAADLLTFLQMQLAADPKTDAKILAGMVEKLGDSRQTEMPASRARELMERILSARLGRPAVAFASLTQGELHALAKQVLNGGPKAAAVNVPKATGYYSNAVKVQLAAYDRASEADKAKVTMPVKAYANKTVQERRAAAKSPATVRTLFGELFMNRDVTLFDAEQGPDAVKGERIRAFVVANQIELDVLAKASDEELGNALSALPEPLRAAAKKLVTESLAPLLSAEFAALDQAAQRQRCAALEPLLDSTADEVMERLQTLADTLFPDRPDNSADLTDWKAPLEKKGANGIDVGTPEGKIVSTVLKHYFTACDRVEKRAMMASYVRAAVAGEGQEQVTEGQQLAAALKGAGPILQKMMQGLPLDSFGPETQKAIRDMKCNLLPIPDSVIRAQLLDLVRNSNGNILSVTVKKPIGSATVAQALLCHITTKDSPYTGKDVVIKLQRPNSPLAALREEAVISGILARYAPPEARDTLAGVFRQQYEGILEEFDFTVEAENIDVAHANYHVVDNEHADVRSMDRYHDIMPGTGILVLEKIDGVTLESSVNRMRSSLDVDGVVPGKVAVNPDDPGKPVLDARDFKTVAIARNRFSMVRRNLVEQRRVMVELIDLWFAKGLFGDGFLHADMHAGNMMTNEMQSGMNVKCDISFIDFGNVQRMSKAEQSHLLKLIICCGENEPENGAGSFIGALKDMVSGFGKALSSAQQKELKKKLAGIFRKGGTDELIAKLGVAVSTVQSYGVTLPASVGAFLTSIARLRNALASIDGALAECEQKMGRIGCAPQPGFGDLGIAIPESCTVLKAILSDMDKVMKESSVYGCRKDSITTALGDLKKNDGKEDGADVTGMPELFKPGKDGGKSPIRKLYDFMLAINPATNDSLQARYEGLADVLATAETAAKNSNYAWREGDAKAYRNLLHKMYIALEGVATESVVADPDATHRDSFEEVLANVVDNHYDQIDKSKININDATNFIYASDIDEKNKALRTEAETKVIGKHGEDGLAETAAAICAYVGAFRLPDGVYATKLKPDQLDDTLNFFHAGLKKVLGRENGVLSPDEIAIASDMLSELKTAELPTGYFFQRCVIKNDAEPNAVDHPMLKAVREMKPAQIAALAPEVQTFVSQLLAIKNAE